METKQANFSTAFYKGTIGENKVADILKTDDWYIMRPPEIGRHNFDMLAVKNDGSECMMVDVKTKARLNAWPATGINQEAFECYWELSRRHNMKFWLVFVDEHQNEIYGNYLTKLEEPMHLDGQSYPRIITGSKGELLRIWSLKQMNHIAWIGGDMAEQLKIYSQRNYEYSPQEIQPHLTA